MNLSKLFVFGSALIFAIIQPAQAADPLDLWEPVTVPGTGALNSVAYGNGIFVTVGGEGRVLRSSDGANWTNSGPVTAGALNRVRFLDGQFTVVGSTGWMFRSSDGASWSSNAVPAGKNFWDVAWGNGRFLLAGDSVYVSTDAVNWTAADPKEFIFGTLRNVVFETVIFSNGEFTGVAVAMGSGPATQGEYHSADGATWRFTSGPFVGVASARSQLSILNGRYVLGQIEQGTVFFSTNGSNWSASLNLAFNGRHPGVAFGAGRYVAAGRTSGLGFDFQSSTNLANWTLRFPVGGSPVPDAAYVPNSVAFGSGRFVVVGASGAGALIYRSGDLGGAPDIITQPLDRAAVVGNPTTFSVVAAGSEPLHYFWEKDESTIPDATNSVFTISSVVATDTGGYRVIITNNFGSVTSRVAQLSASFLDIHQYAGITILGVVGKTYRIEAAPAAGGGWTTLTNLVLPRSPYIWIDFESPNVDSRLYRAAELP